MVSPRFCWMKWSGRWFTPRSHPGGVKYTEEGAMPPLPGGSRPGRSCVCVAWKHGSAVRQRPRCVLSHAREPCIRPLFLSLLVSLRCRVAHIHEQLAGQTGAMRVSSEFLLFYRDEAEQVSLSSNSAPLGSLSPKAAVVTEAGPKERRAPEPGARAKCIESWHSPGNETFFS